jgi:peptidoglycan/xylan/chitin deacetylase (PgdA/CDA1 family)
MISRRQVLRQLALLGASAWIGVRPAQAVVGNAPFTVYLTFDDGPTTNQNRTGPTWQVLNYLRQEAIAATFFLHGRAINAWEGPVLAQMIYDGHAIGNHLWQQGGNTILDAPLWTRMAKQYILAERKIRQTLRDADFAAYQRYLKQAPLYRRPGGNNGLTGFLDPANFPAIWAASDLGDYEADLGWLEGVYDYSGWHTLLGDGIPRNQWHPKLYAEASSLALYGGYGYWGVQDYLCAGPEGRYSQEASGGLIILLHDAADICLGALPQVVDTLRGWGANFAALPRPTDTPNSFTVGLGRDPTPNPVGALYKF